jgi:hypothetical protein
MSADSGRGVLHAGLTGIELPEEEMEFSGGILLRRTYARLTAPFLVSFVRPTKDNPMGTPLKAASGGFSFEITAELIVPPQGEPFGGDHIRALKEILALLRLWVSPEIRCPVFSTVPYAVAVSLADSSCRFTPLEIEPRHFILRVPMGTHVDSKFYEWPKANLSRALALLRSCEELRSAVQAIDRGQFIENRALTLVSLWGALESLFLSNKTELTFRLSAMVSSYLESPGASRHELQKKVVKLYGKRSSAAHGAPEEDAEAVFETFVLLRRVILKMMIDGEVPSKADLEGRLFGSTTATTDGPRFSEPADTRSGFTSPSSA